MTNQIRRYLVPTNESGINPVEAAFDLLEELSRELNKDAFLLVPTKKYIEDTTLEEFLGRNEMKTLLQGKSIELQSGKNLILESQRTFQYRGASEIIIGIYVTKRMLNQIDSVRNAVAVIVVPWNMDEVVEWRETWNPEIVGDAPTVRELLIENPVIEEALKALTISVNLSSGLSHPLDKASAVNLFHLLRDNRELYDSDSIRAWALRNGWTPSGADQLRDVAQDILDGKRIRGGRHPRWRIEILRERATSNR